VLSEAEIEKKGKGAILKEMRKNNFVAFPDRSDSDMSNYPPVQDPLKMSRIEQLRAGTGPTAPNS
jgi:stalled ribosome alternative rescue factor ArfA